MIVALIDNGSLDPAAHRNLRAVAKAISEAAGVTVHPVSWKHSDRIRPDQLNGVPADTLAPWLEQQHARGERQFVFIPFFISAQGAIGSWLRRDIEKQRLGIGRFGFQFTRGLAELGALAPIVASRIRETVTRQQLKEPPVVVVDHGGPSPASAALRNQIAGELRRLLGTDIGPLIAASMEGADHPHNRPLFTDVLSIAGFDRGDVVIAPLFLSPGRHAGPRGDLSEIATAAEDRLTAAPLHCHFTGLVGNHPDVVPALASAVTQTLSTIHAAA